MEEKQAPSPKSSFDRRAALGLLSATSFAGALPVAAEASATPWRGPPMDPQQLVLQPGVYRSSDFLPARGGMRIVAAVPGTVRILIEDGSYFQDIPDYAGHLLLDGLTFVGGKGAVRLGWTGVNVSGPMEISRCNFLNYTECAIGNNAKDHPYLRVRDCIFECAEGAAATGIAWGGFADSSIIEGNVFIANRYHVKIGPRLSGSFHIRMNDFILIRPMERDADIWIVPNSDPHGSGVNSGFGSTISENKFGTENQTPGRPRILIAEEDGASGSDRLSRAHATDWAENAFVSGLTISNNRIASISVAGAPFLLSYISELRYLSWLNNKLDGGTYDYAVAFSGNRKPTRWNANWRVERSAADGPAILRLGFCNQPLLSGSGDI